MYRRGRYVRRIESTSSEDDEVLTQTTEETVNQELSHSDFDDKSNDEDVSQDSCDDSTKQSSPIDETVGSPTLPSESPHTSSPALEAVPRQTVLEQVNANRINRMEKMIENINNALNRFQAPPTHSDEIDKSWKFSNETDQCGRAEYSTSHIRWDHLKAFPSGIAANKMWEEWNRYVENFEIAASLSNVTDPVKRTQLLFLSMGDEKQGIVKAAKLRQGLSNPGCYSTFVTNIQQYLRSMTDTAAEHEAFSKMTQANGESAVAFHARLMCKVRSCNYSIEDEDRFVRAQLLTGLRNRELVKQSRTYGYDTNFIVQSATRNEAFESEIKQRDEHSVLENRSDRSRQPYDQVNRKRLNTNNRNGGPPKSQQRYNDSSQRPSDRRSRCTRCFLVNHRNGICPALNRNCNVCGKRGHFAAVCRQKQVNVIHSRPTNNMMNLIPQTTISRRTNRCSTPFHSKML
ncbi:uncharacterized protein LOC131433998 [Malaya genurostris]|uniref:uncharacterized protein LOC131433998 n=1 Tax=Malaya genurostris TaxID=325434 RepID=UPI0026F396E8|nr:uncharacterized protein LOC131433998 [Malaya genurostris]